MMGDVIKELKKFYTINKRDHLPWRATHDPYKILVSEIMLQQTQVSRVIQKYRVFIEVFPNIDALAKADFKTVLKLWSGLGYNRRARYLHQAAKVIVEKYAGRLPKEVSELENLPGIGPYTARAVATFAYNEPNIFIETNIRTVFFHHFFQQRHSHILQKTRIKKIADAELLPLVKKNLAQSKLEPREFYYALMDYGSQLKKDGVRTNAKSKHYTKQSKFEGSNRQLRGAILRELLDSPKNITTLIKTTSKNIGRKESDVARELARLQQEGLVSRRGPRVMVAP